MEQDIERSREALSDKNRPIAYPAVIYVETSLGNIGPIIVAKSDSEYTEYFWGRRSTYKAKKFLTVSDAFQMNPHSQSEARLFFIDDVSEEDIDRILKQAEQNKKV